MSRPGNAAALFAVPSGAPGNEATHGRVREIDTPSLHGCPPFVSKPVATRPFGPFTHAWLPAYGWGYTCHHAHHEHCTEEMPHNSKRGQMG